MTTALEVPKATPPPPAPQAETSVEPLWEIVDGQRVELPEMSELSNTIKTTLIVILGPFVRQAKLGRAAVETVFILDEEEKQQRRPDVAFISYERWPANRPPRWEGESQVVPDLCVEITSPHDLHHAVIGKVHDYLRYGVREVWVITPNERLVSIHRSRTDVTYLAPDDTLTTPLLPGLELPLTTLFAEVEPNTAPSSNATEE